MVLVVVPTDSAGLLQFEVCPLTDSSFSVSFQHPVNESLVCGECLHLQNRAKCLVVVLRSFYRSRMICLSEPYDLFFSSGDGSD